MKLLVLSGINLFEGGPLSIFYDCLDALLSEGLDNKYKIIAFVHKKSIFEKYSKQVEFIELPDSRESYFKRLSYEYIYFNRFSRKHQVDVWISLHDITPRVKANKRYTYCHNPAPFMDRDLLKIKYSARNVAFSFFYRYLYRINIKKATALIVQQDWMRQAFFKMFPVKNIIVARPSIKIDYKYVPSKKNTDRFVFLFASFPRYFKNFEVICEACKCLGKAKFEVWFTLDGSENTYSKDLVNKYGDLKNIKWLGLQTRESLFALYSKADCFIFPSTLETWGLPVSEFKQTGKPMILADKPYAKETLGTYDKAVFFNPNDATELAQIMKQVLDGNLKFEEVTEKEIAEPYAADWKELFEIIL